jgi:hypothetical protein
MDWQRFLSVSLFRFWQSDQVSEHKAVVIDIEPTGTFTASGCAALTGTFTASGAAAL